MSTLTCGMILILIHILDIYNKEVHDSADLMAGGIAAGSLLSLPRGRSVEDLNAVGFGTLTSQTHQDCKW